MCIEADGIKPAKYAVHMDAKGPDNNTWIEYIPVEYYKVWEPLNIEIVKH